MSRLLSRLWIVLLARLRRLWMEEEVSPSPASTPPPEHEALRRNAAGLAALAAQTRLELAELVARHDTLTAEVERLLAEGHDTAARDRIVEMERHSQRLSQALAVYPAQARAAEAAIFLFHRREAEWRAMRDEEKRARRLERGATLAGEVSHSVDALPRSGGPGLCAAKAGVAASPPSPLTTESLAADTPVKADHMQADPVEAARSLLATPQPSVTPERTAP